MGRTYIAKNKKAKGNSPDYDVNYSGAEILGYLMHAVGEHSKAVEDHDAQNGLSDRSPCTKFEMTKEECVRSATKLETITEEQLAVVFEKCKSCFEKDSTPKDLKDMTQRWIDFLKTCNGYEVN